VAPYIRKKLALTSATNGGRSVGIVLSWTQATAFSVFGLKAVRVYTAGNVVYKLVLLSHPEHTTSSSSSSSAVGTATGCGLDDRGTRVRIPAESRIFTSPNRPGRLLGPPSLLSNAFLSLVVRWPERQVDHSPSTSAGSTHPLPQTSSWRND
jgi:hypothetical protein